MKMRQLSRAWIVVGTVGIGVGGVGLGCADDQAPAASLTEPIEAAGAISAAGKAASTKFFVPARGDAARGLVHQWRTV